MPTAEELAAEFEEKKFNCPLGQLILKLIIIDPVKKLYADGTIDSIVVQFNDGRTVNIKPEEVGRLAEQSEQQIYAAVTREDDS